MAITAASLAGGAFADNTTSVSRSMGSVTAGQLIVVSAGKFSPSSDPFVAGDCTKSAGTATIGTVSLGRTDGGSTGTGAFAHSGVWWAIVTGSGTLTMQVGGAVAGSYLWIGAEAFNGNWDASSEEAENGTLNTGDSISSLGSGNATSAGAALFVGALALNTSNSTTINPDAAFTTIFESEDGTAHAVGSSIYRIVGSGTTDAADWTFTALSGDAGDGGCCTLVVFKEAAGGSTITGSGTPAAQSATTAGTAEREEKASGTPAAQNATAAGTAERELRDTGSPVEIVAQSATTAGTATVGTDVTGSGTPAAQSATVAGTAERSVTGAGTPAAQSATVAGAAERAITSQGTPAAQSGTAAGTAERAVTGSGAAAAQNATTVGAGQAGSEIVASGAPAAQSASAAGTAERSVTSSGSLAAQSGSTSGAAEVAGQLSASGAVVAQSATIISLAERILTATGAVAAQSASTNSTIGEEVAPRRRTFTIQRIDRIGVVKRRDRVQ